MKNRLKYIIHVFFIFFSVTSVAQSNNLKGYYLDSWKYRPEKLDSASFEIYPGGVNKKMEDENSINIDFYLDENYKQLDYSIYVNKFVRSSIPDSFKTIFFYNKENFNYKTVSLERIAFRSSGGCFVYKNQKNKEVWKINAVAFNMPNQYGDIISTMICQEQENYRRDTLEYNYQFLYDDKKNIIQEESYMGDSLTSMVKYEYRNEYKKTEVYYHDKSLKTRTEEFFKDNRLIREKIYYNYHSKYTHDNTYYYDSSNRKIKMETRLFNKSKENDIIRTRTYYYDK